MPFVPAPKKVPAHDTETDKIIDEELKKADADGIYEGGEAEMLVDPDEEDEV
jgi:hypothetical protein